MVLEIARADFALKWLFLTLPTPKPVLRSKSFRSDPPKVGAFKAKEGQSCLSLETPTLVGHTSKTF